MLDKADKNEIVSRKIKNKNSKIDYLIGKKRTLIINIDPHFVQ